MKIIVILSLVGLILLLGGFFFIKKYPNSPLIPYSPKGPTYQTEENENEIGNPIMQKDQAADAARKFEIETYEQALKNYYSTYKRSPENLEELVSLKLIKSVKLDQVTKLPPTYTPEDSVYGCKVELPLSDGTLATGYCK